MVGAASIACLIRILIQNLWVDYIFRRNSTFGIIALALGH